MSEERTAVEFLDKLACVRCVTNVCKCDCARGEECLLGLGEHPCTAGELVSGLREVLAKREVEVAARLREMRAEVEGAGLMAMQGEYDRIVMLLDNKTQISYRVSIRDGHAVSVYSPDASGQGKHILWLEGWGKPLGKAKEAITALGLTWADGLPDAAVRRPLARADAPEAAAEASATEEAKEEPRVVQLVSHKLMAGTGHALVALCSDGTMWVFMNEWKQMLPPPIIKNKG